MEKKTTFRLMAISTITLSVCVGLVAFAGSNSVSVPAFADQTYSLTMDTNNFSDFSCVEEGLYRGTFKTALGNDITFTTNKERNLIDGNLYWNVGNYIKSNDALSGLNKIEVSASVNRGQGNSRTYPKLRAEMLVDPNQPESFYYVDIATNTDNIKTYTINIREEGSGNFVNLKMFEGTGMLIISSIKFYFSCSNTVNPIAVAANNANYGTVSIEGSENMRTAVKNGASVTVHANPNCDFENELFYSFKGWHLNGSEEIISTNPDYTFTTVKDSSYSLMAEFVEAETELFSHGEHIADDSIHTFVYSNKAKKYYSIIGATDTDGSYSHSTQPATRKNNELFIERHQFVQYASSYKSYFKLNAYSPRHGTYNVKWLEDDQIEKFDPTKVRAVILYLAMDESGRIDELSSSNGTFTTYRNLQDPLDGNKAMSKVVWTGFTTAETNVYVPDKYRNGGQSGTLWIKRMKVVYR